MSSRRIGALLVAAALLGLVAPGLAQTARKVGVLLMVTHISKAPGPIDPAGAELDRRLREEFRYQSLRVIERRMLRLGLQEVGGLDLPTGKKVSIRPMHLGEGGVLISVTIEGILDTDVRIPSKKQVDIGAERYENGKLIVTLQPDY